MKKEGELIKGKWQLIIALSVYKIVIEIIYYQVISPLYGYYGLITNIDTLSFFLSILYFFIFCISIPKNNSLSSTSIYTMVGIFIFIPSISYYWLSSQSHRYTFMLTLCFFIISTILRVKRFYISDKSKFAKGILLLCFLLYILSTIIIILTQGGFDARALSFDTIYSLRQDLDLPSILQYILNWCVKVFTPFFFAYFFYKKKYKYMFLVLFIQLSLYLTFGYKAYLFSVALLIICLFLARFNNFEEKFTYFYLCIIVVSTLVYVLFGSSTLLNSIPFRMVFVPAQAQYQYYDFFSFNPKVHFADGLIGSIFSIESPYSVSMFNVISQAYYGDMFSQNTGVFGDAYGNGGIVAMMVIAVALGIVLYLIDVVTVNIPKIIVVSSFSYMIFVLNDNSLLTALLTGGMGLLIILFYLFNAESKYSSSKKIKLDSKT